MYRHHDDEEVKESSTIGDLVGDFEKRMVARRAKNKPAPHRRADMINQVVEFYGDNYLKEPKQGRFKYWNGRLAKKSPDEIFTLMRKAKEGKTPHKLFNWLIKNG